MKGKTVLIGGFVAIFLAIPAVNAAGSTYSCFNGVVHVGDSSYTVKQKCGEPNEVEELSGGGAESVKQNWYYGGGMKLPYLFSIEGGKLQKIERLNR